MAMIVDQQVADAGGITRGGGGIAILPGGKPVPVPPRDWRSRQTQEVLGGLALAELAGPLVSDPALRRRTEEIASRSRGAPSTSGRPTRRRDAARQGPGAPGGQGVLINPHCRRDALTLGQRAPAQSG